MIRCLESVVVVVVVLSVTWIASTALAQDDCFPPCRSGFVCSDGVCISEDEACFPACRSGFTCSGGTCVPEGEGCVPACREGFMCVDGNCVPACNPPCLGDQICTSEGECIEAPLSPEEQQQRAEEEETRRRAEEEARRLEEEERLRMEEEARIQAEEEARLQAEAEAAEREARQKARGNINVQLLLYGGARSFRTDEFEGDSFHEEGSQSLETFRWEDGFTYYQGLSRNLSIPDFALGLGIRQYFSDYFGYTFGVATSLFPLSGYVVGDNGSVDADLDEAEALFVNIGVEATLRALPFARSSTLYIEVGPLGNIRIISAGSRFTVGEFHIGLVSEVGFMFGTRDQLEFGFRFTADDLADGNNYTFGAGFAWGFVN